MARDGQTRPRRRRRTQRLSAAQHSRSSATRSRSASGPIAGGMMSSASRRTACRARCSRRDARIAAMGVSIVLDHKVEDVLAEKSDRRLRRRVPRHRRAHRQEDADPRARRREASSMRSRFSGASRRRGAEARPPRRHVRRRQHGDGCGARRQAPRARPDDHLPARSRSHAGAHARGRRSDRRGRQDPLAPHDQGDRRRRRSSSRSWSSTTRASHGRRVAPRRSRPTRSSSRSGKTSTRPSSSASRVSRWRGRRRQCQRQSHDRSPRDLRGGDMVPSERTVTIAVGHGKRAAR